MPVATEAQIDIKLAGAILYGEGVPLAELLDAS